MKKLKIFNKNFKKLLTLFLSVSMVLLSVGSALAATVGPVDLGKAGNYAILAKSGISTVPNSVINGDIGVSPIDSTALTGFALTKDATNQFSTSAQVTGNAYASNYASPTPSNLTTAVSDMEAAYTDAAGRAADKTELYAGDISGQRLVAGVYKWSNGVVINTDVTLNGSANDVFIFQIAQGITQAPNTKIILTGGAQAKNIFWQAAKTVTIKSGAHFEGIVLSMTNITLGTKASINGRLLAQTAVTLDQSTVKAPITVTPPVVTPPVVPTALQTATAAVIKGEGSKLKADVDSAKLLVNALPADVGTATDKQNLLDRLDTTVVALTEVVTPTTPTTNVVTATVSGGQLPKTSTPLYEILILGVALTLVGAVGWRSRRRYA